MPLIKGDARLDNLAQALENLAQTRQVQIIEQAETRRMEMLTTAKERIQRENEYTYQDQAAALSKSVASERSTAVVAIRQRLFKERADYAEVTFQKAYDKLASFVASEDYVSFLQNLTLSIAAKHDLKEAILSLRAEDMKYQSQLASLLDASCQFETSPEVKLGGLLIWLPQQKIIIDERLETRLEQERTWFYEHSGLSVTW